MPVRAGFSGPAITLALGLGAGCASYFSWPSEPGWEVWAALVGLTAGLAFGLQRLGRAGLAALIVLFATGVLAGGLRSQVRTEALARSGVIDTRGEAQRFSGWLEARETTAAGRSRLLVRLDDSEGRVRRIRVRAEAGAARPGDAIAVRAVIAPPPGSAVPGGYDFAFHALGQRIAGTGFAIAPVALAPDTGRDRVARSIARLRWTMAERIRARMPERTGAIASALLTGDRSALHREDVEALRASGLGHLLAISGMHMALLAGGIFLAVRAVLALWTGWAARHDAARPAAIAALIAATAYLILSGAAIPTQRAFIMTVSVLGAVILRRRALSMHTLALAAMIVLWLRPEAIVSPGFQMSFAAVGALIAVADAWRQHRPPPAPFAPLHGLRLFLGGLTTTSLVAGMATSGFAALHFHRTASFGLAGNLLAMPVFSLIVMPSGVLALFLMPLGLEAPALWVMDKGLAVVLAVAAWVESWPGSLQPVPAAPAGTIGLYAAGFAGLVLAAGRARWVAAGLLALSLLVWGLAARPDAFVSEAGLVMMADGQGGWSVSDNRRSRFARTVFLERVAAGEGGAGDAADAASPAAPVCDRLGCRASSRAQAHGQAGAIAWLAGFDELATDCRRNALLVTERTVPAHIARACDALILDPADRARRGGALVWFGADGDIARIRRSYPPEPARPWHPGWHQARAGRPARED